MKYLETRVTFSEIPDELTLCINITNCPNNCEGCHSPHLQKDIGEELTYTVLNDLINKNKGITCICFMGGDRDPLLVYSYGKYIKNKGLKFGWYSGNDALPVGFGCCEILKIFDYIKLGHYDKSCGPLNSSTTNQLFFKKITFN